MRTSIPRLIATSLALDAPKTVHAAGEEIVIWTNVGGHQFVHAEGESGYSKGRKE